MRLVTSDECLQEVNRQSIAIRERVIERPEQENDTTCGNENRTWNNECADAELS